MVLSAVTLLSAVQDIIINQVILPLHKYCCHCWEDKTRLYMKQDAQVVIYYSNFSTTEAELSNVQTKE